MKVFLAILTYMALSTAYAVNVEDLTFNCQGFWKITEVSEAKFNPAVPPRGRHNGFPSSGTVEVKLEIVNFQNVECSLLKSKYGADLKGPIQATIHVSEPLDLKAVEWLAGTLKEKMLPFQSHQSFNHVLSEKYLPLYPDIVEETLYLKSENKQYGVAVPIEFSEQLVYGVNPVDNWDEQKKIELAQRLVNMLKLNKSYGLSEFHNLYLNLKFSSADNQRRFFLLTWKVFQQVGSNPSSEFFYFSTGGAGAFVGSPFANKFTQLANISASDSEKVEILSSFPSLLRADTWLEHECLDLSAEQFNQVLQKWNEQYESFLIGKQSHIQRMLKAFVDPAHHLNNKCLLPLQTPENLELSQKLLQLKGD